MKTHVVILAILFEISLCRDFYVGMKKKNDLMVAQDTLYKEKNTFGYTTAKYGRIFNCPITYFKVADRLGAGSSPAVTVIRGGLRKKYIVLQLTSSFDSPIAVNIHVACENKIRRTTTTTADPGSPEEMQTSEAEDESEDADADVDEDADESKIESHENQPSPSTSDQPLSSTSDQPSSSTSDI